MKPSPVSRGRLKVLTTLAFVSILCVVLTSSSHREAPLISNDPLADNTDLYAFRSPDNTNKIMLIANFIPGELPQGGPNFYTFGENIRYEIHIDNNIQTPGDDIIYRFTFKQTNQDPTTFFNIRLGKINLYTTYICERSIDGGASFSTIISNGIVAPNNIGPRSIDGPVGLGATVYDYVMNFVTNTASTGEKVYCGPIDDPFYVDLGGIFDIGDAPRQSGKIRDGLARYNVHSICVQVDISTLQKQHKTVAQASSILDPDFVIGVWASASRRATKTLSKPVGGTPFDPTNGAKVTESGNWVQVSRLGMPLTNEVLIPIGKKDLWNAITPYQDFQFIGTFGDYFFNPEVALYMDDSKFGGAVPALKALRIQSKSLKKYDFRNGGLGIFSLSPADLVTATAFDQALTGGLLIPAASKPRLIDIYPIFHTGLPNLNPYQLATGKNGNPFASGKPFVNNFLPNGGDMLRLNMAVPITNRYDALFSSDGLIQACVLGLTNPAYNGNTNLQFIPNMDGFPNGRRLEDDVTRIELQAVGGVVLAAMGFFYDDFNPDAPGASPVTNQLLNTLTYSTGVEKNDTSFRTTFPYVQAPWRGTAIQGQH